jgi:hypothetical protein
MDQQTKDDPMDIQVFMNIGTFHRHIGMSRWHFMRMVDRYHLPLQRDGKNRLVEVEPTIKFLATVPNIHRMISDRGLELVRPHLQEAQATQDDYLSDEVGAE